MGARLLILGPGPDTTSCRDQDPFPVQGSGRLIRNLVRILKLDPDQIRYDHAVRCGPVSDQAMRRAKTVRGVDGSGDYWAAMDLCARRAEEEGDWSGVEVVLALGQEAACSVLGRKFQLQSRPTCRGGLHRSGRVAVIPTWGLRQLERAGGSSGQGGLSDAELEVLASDLQHAYDLSQRKIWPFEPLIQISDQGSAMRSFVAAALSQEHPVVAVDVETDGVNQLTSGLQTVGVAVRAGSNITALSWRFSPEDRVGVEAVRRLISDRREVLVFFNLQFDVAVLKRFFGPILARIEDVMLLQHAAYPETGHSLAAVGHQHVLVEAWKRRFRSWEKRHEAKTMKVARATAKRHGPNRTKEELEAEAFRIFAESKHSPLWWRRLQVYNAMDAAVTLALVEPLERECEARKVRDVARLDVEQAIIAGAMTERGIYLDPERREELRLDFEKKVVRAEAKVQQILVDTVRSRVENGMDLHRVESLLLAVQRESNRDVPASRSKRCGSASAQVGLFAQHLVEAPEPAVPAVAFKRSGWNPAKRDQLEAAFDLCGVEVPGTALTASGKRSFDKFAMLNVIHQPVVAAIMQVRKYQRFLTSYYESSNFVVTDQNRLHSAWRIDGTPSGRWSSGRGDGSNSGDIGIGLQNWPEIMKSTVSCPPGMVLVGGDMAQLEFRALALLAGEEELLHVFNHPELKVDIHEKNAERIFAAEWVALDPATARDPEEAKLRIKKRKLLRKFTKTGVYGSVYGAVAKTVQAQFRAASLREPDEEFAAMLRRTSEAQCQAFVDAIPRLWPRIGATRLRFIEEISRSGVWVCPLSGRRRVWPLGRVDPPQCLNTPVQTLAGSIVNPAFVEVHRRLVPGAHLVLQVHDAVAIETPEDRAEEMRRILEETMTVTVALGGHKCLFPMEAKIGRRLDAV